MRSEELTHRVAFDARTATDDGYGNTVAGPFVEQFERMAAFVYAGGGEAVMAARLEGRSIIKARLRSDAGTRSIKSGWQMRDVDLGTAYNIREVDAVTDRAWVFLVIEAGVAI